MATLEEHQLSERRVGGASSSLRLAKSPQPGAESVHSSKSYSFTEQHCGDEVGVSAVTSEERGHEEETVVENLGAASDMDPPPDGGYGWVVCAVAHMFTFFGVGMNYIWGLFQARLVSNGLASPSTLAFVGSLCSAAIAIYAIPNAKLMRVIGARNTAFLAALFMGGGSILSSFATENLGALFVTEGLVKGWGTSLCFFLASTVPAQYFTKKRGIANGIVLAGGGVGGCILSFLINAFLDRWGLPWTFRALGLIVWAVLFPIAWFMKERTKLSSREFVDWRLFKETRFTLLFLGGAIGLFPLFVVPYFIPMYSVLIGLSTTAAAALLAAFNMCSAVGRIGFGFMSDRFGPVNTLFFSLMIGALSTLILWPFATSTAPLVVFVILNGISNGGFFSLFPTVVAAVFGGVRVAISMSMILTAWVGGYLMGAPLAGYLLGSAGGQKGGIDAYHPAIFYAGSLSLASAGLIAGLRFTLSRSFSTRA